MLTPRPSFRFCSKAFAVPGWARPTEAVNMRIAVSNNAGFLQKNRAIPFISDEATKPESVLEGQIRQAGREGRIRESLAERRHIAVRCNCPVRCLGQRRKCRIRISYLFASAGNRKSRASPASSESCRPGMSGLASTTGAAMPLRGLTSSTAAAASNSTVGHAL